MLLQSPIVMLSSTIGELAALRQKVGREVEQAGAATAWRFEVHAVAAGDPPDEQYLRIANSCDLYVLIIGSQQSDATEAEYGVAYADNPEKVLPFFLGEGSAAVADFRALIDLRHARVKRDSVEDLAGPITDAILAAVASGRMVRPLLISEIDRRIERARAAIADIPLILEPRVIVGEKECAASGVIGLGTHVALSGIGGAGKTMVSLVAARRAARDGGVLPIYAVATEEAASPTDLVCQCLQAAHFRASSQVVDRWGAEGRIMLVVDGIESLSPTRRRHFMTNMSRWGERFSRCGVVVCARQFSSLELTDFVSAATAPLGDAQMRDLAEALGFGANIPRFSEQVRDIARWPMWATALLAYGPEVSTGLELLRKLVETRLRTAGMSSPIEEAELRAAAAFVAYDMWPATTSTVPQALDRIRRWRDEPTTSAMFASRPAGDILHLLGEAALVEVGNEVAFLHRLIATLLAAEHAIIEPRDAQPTDEELAPFVAALADDEEHIPLLRELLSTHDVFVLARYLRLTPPRKRAVDLEADVRRLTDAHRLWSPAGDELDVVFSDGWVAWRSASVPRATRSSDQDYAQWRRSSNDSVTFWSKSPFTEHTPEFAAAVDVLGRFRFRALDLDPGGDRWHRMAADEIRRLMKNRTEFDATVIATLRNRQDVYQGYLDQLGRIDPRSLAVPVGSPHVTIWAPLTQDPLVSVSWGSESPIVDFVTSTAADALTRGRTIALASLLSGQDQAAVFDDLKGDIEEALGCRLSAQTWRRPELVPAWAW